MAIRPPAAALAALLVALFPAQPRPPAPSIDLDAAGRVSADRLRRTVRELVALGSRMGGTPSGDRAAGYVEAAFRRLGLPARVVRDPDVLAYWTDGWSLEIVPSGAAIESAWPYVYSPAVAPARTAPLAAADRIEAAADAAGRAVYTPAPVTAAAYDTLARAETAPALVITSAPDDPKKNLDYARLGSLPGGARAAIPVFAVSYVDGRTLMAAAADGASVRFLIEARTRRAPPLTVLAELGGRQPGRYYLLCAHGDSDSGGPGADDNASSVAVVLEVAAVLHGLVRDGRLPPPRAGIRFAIWGAEYHSARAYVAREGKALADLAGVINLDQTGTGAEREAVYFESNDVPWNGPLLRVFEAIGRAYRGREGFWPDYATTPSQGGTDAYVFLPEAYKGEGAADRRIPATTVYTAAWDAPVRLKQTPGWDVPGARDPTTVVVDYSLYYHSSGDTPANTTEREPQNMVRAARAVVLALLRLAWREG
ncbi:MAG TPA: M28 family peptidase [Vicinamibacterales bacterium]|nr:M28 family peptidase [Vicinamibacterales bacterium]